MYRKSCIYLLIYEVRNTMAAILIVEPDLHCAHQISAALTLAGHVCRTVASAASAMEALHESPRMLTIINARLPWTDSIALLRLLEERGWPILFVTADAGNIQHLHALYQGVCGVLLSPFDADRLEQCVTALLAETSRLLTIGSLRLDTQARQATLDGESLDLTAQEFALLEALMHSPDAPLTREELLRTAWGYQDIGDTRTVDVHVQRLRRKLGASCIETVYKLGYRLKMA